jgi:hypothetical protein
MLESKSESSLIKLAAKPERPSALKEPTIVNLSSWLEGMQRRDPERFSVFEKIYEVEEIPSTVSPNHPNLEIIAARYNLTVEDLTTSLIRVNNKVTGEQVTFSPLRARRGLVQRPTSISETEESKNDSSSCDLCHAWTNTPEDEVTGRIVIGGSMTCGNLLAFAPHHILIFPSAEFHNPSHFTGPLFEEMIQVAKLWSRKVFEHNRDVRFLSIGWNKLPRAGATKLHPHWQMTQDDSPEPEVRDLSERFFTHRLWSGDSYENNLTFALGSELVHEIGEARVVFHLSPRKEKEAIIFVPRLNRDLALALDLLLDFWQSELRITSWNMAIFAPPVHVYDEERARWESFPHMVRIVDRGVEGSKISDIGYKELYNLGTVVSYDPFELSRAFGRYLGEDTP